MTEILVAVAEGDFTFGPELLVDALRARWPETSWTPTPAGDLDPSLGQISVPTGGVVLVEVLPAAQGLGIEGLPTEVAQVLAVVAGLDGFPDDGTVLVTDWADELYALPAGGSAETIEAAWAG